MYKVHFIHFIQGRLLFAVIINKYTILRGRICLVNRNRIFIRMYLTNSNRLVMIRQMKRDIRRKRPTLKEKDG